ncbi:uncharacterized protein LOC127051344 [Gopherus flavomarginatus]|uniref:uncharacterized protein LOC127051344 n=1 Tax=Gopherus flavomarginatus TaxID=286002 RepID=UPI0021CC20CB|nr:uncharacterized protein LOC127051344 [Gopherus flavomarginatus]
MTIALLMQRCSASVATKSAVIGLQRYSEISQNACSATLLISLNSTALASGDPPFKCLGNLKKSPSCLLSQVWSAISESFQVTMPPRAKRAPAWSNGELLDLISVWGEEAVQSQLRSSCRNYDTCGQISRAMLERGHDWDALQCRVKVKELWSAYCKAREVKCRSGAAPTTCHFYKELDAILGGDPTTNPRTMMDTSEREGGRRKLRVRVLGWGKTPRSPWRHAARSSSQARRKVTSCSSWYLVEDKQRSGFPVSGFYFQDGNFSREEGGLGLHACLDVFIGRSTAVLVLVWLTRPRHCATRGGGTIARHRQTA